MDNLVKKNINNLKEYIVDTNEYDIRLDANESPYNLLEVFNEEIMNRFKTINSNRYPDTESVKLRKQISKYTNVNVENIICGNGSDELIQAIINTFVDKDETVITHVPTFSMYKVSTSIVGGNVIEIKGDEGFNINVDDIIDSANNSNAKVIIINNPNNPTGNFFSLEEIIKILDNTDKVVIVDEAYYEFCGVSAINLIDKYEKLIVLRTLSKAFSLAGARVGYLAANSKMIKILNKVKAPYNLNVFSQTAAEVFLENTDIVKEYIDKILHEKEYLYNELKSIDNIKAFKSYSNFILVKVLDSFNLGELCKANSISIRAFSSDPLLKNCYRISVGTREENDALLKVMRKR